MAVEARLCDKVSEAHLALVALHDDIRHAFFEEGEVHWVDHLSALRYDCGGRKVLVCSLLHFGGNDVISDAYSVAHDGLNMVVKHLTNLCKKVKGMTSEAAPAGINFSQS